MFRNFGKSASSSLRVVHRSQIQTVISSTLPPGSHLGGVIWSQLTADFIVQYSIFALPRLSSLGIFLVCRQRSLQSVDLPTASVSAVEFECYSKSRSGKLLKVIVYELQADIFRTASQQPEPSAVLPSSRSWLVVDRPTFVLFLICIVSIAVNVIFIVNCFAFHWRISSPLPLNIPPCQYHEIK